MLALFFQEPTLNVAVDTKHVQNTINKHKIQYRNISKIKSIKSMTAVYTVNSNVSVARTQGTKCVSGLGFNLAQGAKCFFLGFVFTCNGSLN